jgi:Transglycosylase SLT domain
MTAPNAPLPLLPPGATPAVMSSIRQAAEATGTDFGLLMAQAKQESGFQPDAKASGSSASGLFQFIESTWLAMVQRFGQKYGLGALAQQITATGSGHPQVGDPATRQQILDLRQDPRLSSALAAEYARLNKETLEQSLGRPAGSADIYLAHFLGAGGAVTFLKGLSQGGGTPAADLLPQAAAANRGVFFDVGSGRARSLAEIYQGFAQRIGRDAQQFAAPAPSIPGPATLARSLTFDGRQLSPPMAAMLELFASSALQLLGGDGLPAPTPASTHPL